MKYYILAVLVVIATWYFFFRGDVFEANAFAVPSSPEKQIEAVLELNPVDAKPLGELCQAYPGLVAQKLKNREFKIQGPIEDFRLTGMDGRRAEVQLRTNTRQKILVVFDLDLYARLNLHEYKSGRYATVGTELFFIEPTGRKSLLFAKELRIAQTVVLKNFGATNISFVAVVDAPLRSIF